MSYQGQSPKVNRLRLQPRSSDPVNPAEGDLQYADGTVRDEGIYVYKNGVWTAVVDGQNSTISKISFSPQSADPSSPTEGTVFYADGTSRAKGLWVYKTIGWQKLDSQNYTEFKWQDEIIVKAATTAAISLTSTYAGSSIDGVTLAAGDLILVKNNVPTTDNGVYVVQASPNPLVRYSGANTAAKLTYAQVYAYTPANVNTNGNTVFYQTNVLSSLTDAQNWTLSPSVTRTFVVPDGVTSLTVVGIGGGGGGGGGGRDAQAGGGNGGAGTIPYTTYMPVVPGETLSVIVGAGGIAGTAGVTSQQKGGNGGNGGASQVIGSLATLTFLGGSGGTGGDGVSTNPTPRATITTGFNANAGITIGAGGGAYGASAFAGSASMYASGGAAGVRYTSTSTGSPGPGGGGGAGLKAGGAGGKNGNDIYTPAYGTPGQRGQGIGAGGGGGGGGYNGGTNQNGGKGGPGGVGYLRISW